MKTTLGAQVALLFIVVAGFAWYQADYRARFARIAEQERDARESEMAARRSQVAEQVKIEDVIVGNGAEAKEGDTVTVHYEGSFANGNVFDSSRKHNSAVQFRLGAGQVIPGWDVGMQGMRVGGKRKLVVPPTLAYGTAGTTDGLIPPNATLYFTVELIAIK